MDTCPSADTLEQWLCGSPAEAPAEVDEHVQACPRCRQWLDDHTDRAELRRLAAQARELPAAPAAELERLRRRLYEAAGGGPAVPRRPGDLGTLGPYRLEAELGRGGMGIVYRAVDEALQRTVAVKVLRPEHADTDARTRLVREARLAARFRHDHVVTVHAVVDPPDGLPYLVMEHVPGPTLKALIRQRGTLPPAEAAGLLAQVADALAAAHAAGLIHRDVKPSNILLDPATGRARLADFGLARLAGDADLTRTGDVLGTPEYMSPEQARGLRGLDGRTDVYGLGVTLYEALTGEVPFRGVPQMVLRQILEDEPRPPRRLNDKIPRDLETVCLEALAKEPGRRYQSAAELADDLRRFVRGEPVRARRPGRLERGWRWCRRNPRVAALSLGLLLALAAGFAGVLWQARLARGHAEFAEGQRVLAEARRAEAEAGLREAVGAVDEFFTRVSEERLLRQPQLQGLRRELLGQALAHYRRFLAAHGDNLRLQDEAARAAVRLAWLTAQIGTAAEADAAFGEAVSRYEKLLEADPSVRGYRVELARAHMNRGLARQSGGKVEDALASFRAAAALCEELRAAEPGDRGLLANLLACYGNLANLHLLRGRWRESLTWYDKIQALAEESARAAPDSLEAQRLLGINTHNRAMAQDNLGDREKALAGFEQARAIRQRLADGHPGQAYLQSDLVRSEQMLADVCRRLGHLSRARGHYQEAISRSEKLSRDNPAVTVYRSDLARSYLNLGGFLAEQRQTAEALRALGQARALQRQLCKEDPWAALPWEGLAENLRQTAELYVAGGRPAEALSYLQEALAVYRRWLQAFPEDPAWRSRLGGACGEYGKTLALLGRRGEALVALQEGVDQSRRAFDKEPSVLLYRTTLSDQYRLLSLHLVRQGDGQRAAELSLARSRLWPDRAGEQLAAAGELALAVWRMPAGEDRGRFVGHTFALLGRALYRGLLDAPEAPAR